VTAEILTSARFRDAGFANGFSCRGADEKALATALSVREIAQIKQVHGARVVRLSELHAGAAEVIGDAIVASAKDAKDGRAIAIRVADCVPILVADKVTGSVAAIHAGWRGVEANVIAEAMKAMDAIDDVDGSNPKARVNRIAMIGPSIGACCFEVGIDVADRIANACRDPRAIVHAKKADAKAYVDLRRAVRTQLRNDGLTAASIEDLAGCTKCDDEARFFSFRRDGENAGRHLAAIVPRAPR
jgi:YfiH family protein